MFLYLFPPFFIFEQQGTHRLIWRDDQKPLRFRKKKKNIFGCLSVNAAAHEKTPRRPQKGQKRIGHIKPTTAERSKLMNNYMVIICFFFHI